MSLRELRVLVTNLPPDCATARRMRGHHWGDQEFLLADLLDTVRYHRVEWAMSRGAKPPKPRPVPRPKVGDGAADTTGTVHRELARAAHQHVLDQVLPPAPPAEPP